MQRLWILACLLVVILAPALLAVDFDGDTDSTWETAANWAGDALPTQDDDAVIPDTFDVTLSAAGAACETLTIEDTGSLTLNNAAATLAFDANGVAGALVLASGGTFTLTAGAVSTLVDITVDGTLELANNESLAATGTLTLTGGEVELGADATLTVDALVINDGILTLGAGATLTAGSITITGGAIVLGAGATLMIDDGDVDLSSATTVTADATSIIDATTTGSDTFTAGADVLGNLTLQGTGDWTVAGTIECAGTLTVDADLVLPAANVEAAAMDFVSGAITTNAAGTLTCNGDFTFDGTLTDNGGDLLLESSGATINLGTGFVADAMATAIRGTYELDSNGAATEFFDLTIEDAAALDTVFTESAANDVVVAGDLIVQATNGETVSATFDVALTVTGTTTVIEATLGFEDATFENDFNADADSTIDVGTSFTLDGAAGELEILGTFTTGIGATVGFLDGAWDLNVADPLDEFFINDTAVTLTGDISVSGNTVISNGGSLNTDIFAAAFSGSVDVDDTGTTLTLGTAGASHEFSGNVTVTDGTLDFGDSESSFDADLSIAATGTTTFTAGSVTFTGSGAALISSAADAADVALPDMTVDAGADLSITGSLAPNSVTVDGEIVLDDEVVLELTNGEAFTVSATGTLTTSTGSTTDAPEITTGDASDYMTVVVAGTLDVDGLVVSQGGDGGAAGDSMRVQDGATVTRLDNVQWRDGEANSTYLLFEADHDAPTDARFRGHDFGFVAGITIVEVDNADTNLIFIAFLYDGTTASPTEADVTEAEDDSDETAGTIEWVASIEWEGTVSDDWFDDDNWAGGAAPDAAQEAVIPDVTGTGDFPVIDGATAQVFGVTLQAVATLTIEAGASLEIGDAGLTLNGELEVDGDLACSGNIEVNEGITGAGIITLSGSADIALSGSALNILGPALAISMSGSSSVILINDTAISGAITVTGGVLDLAGDAGLAHEFGGSLTIDDELAGGDSTVTLNAAADLTVGGTGVLVFGGLIVDMASSGEAVDLAADVAVNGDLDIATGELSMGDNMLTISGGDTTIEGTLSFGSGTLIFEGDSLTIDSAGATVGGTGLFRLATEGDVTIDGELDVNDAEIELDSASDTVTISGVLDIAGDWTLTRGEIDLGDGEHSVAGDLVYNLASAGDVTISQDAAGSLAFDGDTQLVRSSGSEVPDGEFAQISVASGAMLTIQTEMTAAGEFNVLSGGRLTLSSGSDLTIGVSGSAGAFTVNSGGEFFAWGSPKPMLHGPDDTDPMACHINGRFTVNALDIGYYDEDGLLIGSSATVTAMNEVDFHDAQDGAASVHLTFLGTASPVQFIENYFDDSAGNVSVLADAASNPVDLVFGADDHGTATKQEDNGATVAFTTITLATLSVSESSNNASGDILRTPGEQDVVVGILRLQSATNSSFIEELTFTAAVSGGASTPASIVDAVRLIWDEDEDGEAGPTEIQIGDDATFTGDTVTFSGSPLFVVPQGVDGAELLVIADFGASDTAGNAIEFSVEDDTDVSAASFVATINGLFPVELPRSIAVEKAFSIERGANSPSPFTAPFETDNVVMLQLRAEGLVGTSTIDGMTFLFDFSHPDMIAGITGANLYLDDNGNGDIDTGETLLDTDGADFSADSPFTAAFIFDTPMTLAAGETVDLIVAADVNNSNKLFGRSLSVKISGSDVDTDADQVVHDGLYITSTTGKFKAAGIHGGGGGCSVGGARSIMWPMFAGMLLVTSLVLSRRRAIRR